MMAIVSDLQLCQVAVFLRTKAFYYYFPFSFLYDTIGCKYRPLVVDCDAVFKVDLIKIDCTVETGHHMCASYSSERERDWSEMDRSVKIHGASTTDS